MTDAAASQSSLNTMLNTIEQATEVVQRVMPEVAMVGGIVPGATVYIQLAGMALPIVQNAIKWIEQQEGLPPLQAFENLVKTISAGEFVSPSLAKPVTDAAT